MDISAFITGHMEQLLVEWEAFARTFGAAADRMSGPELRDHAKQILQGVAENIQREKSPKKIEDESHGYGGPSPNDSASKIHGRLRFASGFTLLQLIAEYRALRASVIKLWQQDGTPSSQASEEEMARFNAAIDQSLADAAVAYTEKLHETRDVFLAILGHDLRGPLAAIATAGSYLAKPDAFDDQVQQIGVRVKRGAATMDGMVNDLLGLARTQLGDGIPIERKVCDLRQICQWAIEDANAVHPHARFELDATGELVGSFDQARLQQLITNLANNAAQYGAPGEPIHVKLVGEKKRVVLTVQNRGPTIPQEALPSLFTALVQLPSKESDVRRPSSLGLGLFIAREIALAHGGAIAVRSGDQVGTIFSVEIPRQ